jgi:hypothetical protein
MTRTLVTVAIPAYNQPALLAETLRSVLAQDYADFQVLVADDDSPYDVESLVASFGDPRIALHQHERRLGDLYNTRWTLCAPTTRYVASLHHDDLWLPHHLSSAIAALESHPEATFYCCATEALGNGPPHTYKPCWSTARTLELCDWRETGFAVWFLHSTPMASSSVVLRREALAGLFWGGKSWPWCNDYLWWGQLALKGPFLYDPRTGAQYRLHESNSTHRYLKRTVRSMAQFRFTMAALATRAYALGGLRDLAAETRHFPAGPLSALIVALAAPETPRALSEQARAIFAARQDLALDPACNRLYRLAVRFGRWYLPYADLTARAVAGWWPIPAL